MWKVQGTSAVLCTTYVQGGLFPSVNEYLESNKLDEGAFQISNGRESLKYCWISRRISSFRTEGRKSEFQFRVTEDETIRFLGMYHSCECDREAWTKCAKSETKHQRSEEFTNNNCNFYSFSCIFVGVLLTNRWSSSGKDQSKHDIVCTIFDYRYFHRFWKYNIWISYNFKYSEWDRVWIHFHWEDFDNLFIILSRRYNVE